MWLGRSPIQFLCVASFDGIVLIDSGNLLLLLVWYDSYDTYFRRLSDLFRLPIHRSRRYIFFSIAEKDCRAHSLRTQTTILWYHTISTYLPIVVTLNQHAVVPSCSQIHRNNTRYCGNPQTGHAQW